MLAVCLASCRLSDPADSIAVDAALEASSDAAVEETHAGGSDGMPSPTCCAVGGGPCGCDVVLGTKADGTCEKVCDLDPSGMTVTTDDRGCPRLTGPSGGCLVDPAETPKITPAAGAYAAPVTVSISSGTPLATIYYTLDGTRPNVASSKYSAPMTITKSTTVWAMAWAKGWLPSELVKAPYFIGADAGVACGQIVASMDSCPVSCVRTFGTSLAPGEACTRTRFVCVSDDSPDTAALVCRVDVATATIFYFTSGPATEPSREPGWRLCTAEEQARVSAASVCDAGS